ncbi:DMT family transporter [Hydromonas duriensis]|uniref:Guanidinium exporter n=1 Tax=Hydromonas duriensis TaxID=1527608 RepID=A0A4R6YBW9_9BURK|nr:multidrug efflux SMR transporter [Hydromonas duriensis]TDR33143.1 quaternary ammonium compound-resistance protein SugE [Hydromonas duriensis]
MAWVCLFIAGLFEVGWVVGLKYTEGFTHFIPSVLTIGAMIVSLWLLEIAMRTLPMGTAYTVWGGVGSVGTVAVGIWLFNEPADWIRLFCVGLIIVGVIGLQWVTH